MRAEIRDGQLVFTKGPKSKRQRVGNSTTHTPVAGGLARPAHFSWLVVIGLLMLSILVAVVGLRNNNLEMVKLRDQLVAADKTGEVGEVQSAALRLQHYVSTHMNTSTDKIALQTMYNHAAEQALAKSKPPDIDQAAYNNAASDCQPQLANYGYEAWATCVATKVGINNTVATQTADQMAPDPDLYYVEYAAVSWSMDIAGVALLFVVALTLLILVKLVMLLLDKLYQLWRQRHAKGV